MLQEIQPNTRNDVPPTIRVHLAPVPGWTGLSLTPRFSGVLMRDRIPGGGSLSTKRLFGTTIILQCSGGQLLYDTEYNIVGADVNNASTDGAYPTSIHCLLNSTKRIIIKDEETIHLFHCLVLDFACPFA